MKIRLIVQVPPTEFDKKYCIGLKNIEQKADGNPMQIFWTVEFPEGTKLISVGEIEDDVPKVRGT